MTPARHHAEWLSLVETSGPFLSMPVLLRVFPQGLDHRDTARAAALRENYEDWLDRGRPLLHVHTAWIRHVLENLLEWPADYIAEGQTIPAGLEASQPHFGETLRPDLVLRRPPGSDGDSTPQILVATYPPTQDLEKPVAGKIWKASPATRMVELLHAANVPLGLVTNGEHWMLVYAPRQETSGFASWYADLWMQESITLRAFHSLLHLRRFFGVAAPDTLAALLAESSKDQQEVTDQLGRQVRHAVEMLVQAFDEIDDDSGRTLLADLPEKEIYDAALTVMMRLVFLFCAEERGLLLLGDALYDQHYAVSTLRELLRERADQHGEEVLERRHDAWSRLLATFRVVHGGVQHESMRLPAYGGSLFDPDRFPFLEGRKPKTRWRETPAQPLPVNNRVVLHLLEALQLLRVRVPGGGPAEARRVSFRALDIEQIGHVYEGLLDHTGRRASEVMLGLSGKNEPEIPLSKLEELAGIDPHAAAEPVTLEGGLMAAETADSAPIPFPTRKVNYGETPSAPAALIDFLKDATGRSANALESALGYGKPKARGKAKAEAPASSSILDLPSSIPDHSLLLACGQDPRLARRIRPFAGLLRTDDFGRLAVIRPGSVFVTQGSDRRSTGTHYTQKSLTEPIVKHTLDPLVYTGPAEGLPETEWKLKSPREILALKVCDLAMGSGAFLVQACRYLAERLCEAWEIAEKEHAGSILITPDGEFSTGSSAERLLPLDPAERLAIARRYVADRCLYGVDINPMAVEMAKLSLWLITLQKDRPFTFVDHALKCGDSLLGISHVRQLERFSLRESDAAQPLLDTANLWRHIEEATRLRRDLEATPSDTPSQLDAKLRLHREAETQLAKLRVAADFLIAAELDCPSDRGWESRRALAASHMQAAWQKDPETFQQLARHELKGRRPFQWPLEFPEVFEEGKEGKASGFDAFVGNPPFMGGKKLTGEFGTNYRTYLVERLANGKTGVADLCAYFVLRLERILSAAGTFGLITTDTIAQGDTREVGLDQLAHAITLFGAVPSHPWPGTASVIVSLLWGTHKDWKGACFISDLNTTGITPFLTAPEEVAGKPHRLAANIGRSFIGSQVHGEGFIVDKHIVDRLIAASAVNREVLFPYLNGRDVNTNPDQSPSRWIINFFDWPEKREADDDYDGPVAADYSDVLAIIREKVKPERDHYKRKAYRERWWRYAEPCMALYRAIQNRSEILVKALVSPTWAFAFVESGMVYDQKLVVLVDWPFAILQSSHHYVWTLSYGATMGLTTLTYTPTDCCETFPFPAALNGLESIGERYHEHRRRLMLSRQEGLTKTYNRFHDLAETSPDIVELRSLHRQLDVAVAAAYGWEDLAANDGARLGHGFHETKQGIRYTLAPAARREVLDRLLALNHQRHAEELAAGLHDKKKGKAKKSVTKRATKTAKGYDPPPDLFPPAQPDLFG